jgi:hypothetical protein
MNIVTDINLVKLLAKTDGRDYPENFWQFYCEWVNATTRHERIKIMDKYGLRVAAYNQWLYELEEIIQKHLNQVKKMV